MDGPPLGIHRDALRSGPRLLGRLRGGISRLLPRSIRGTLVLLLLVVVVPEVAMEASRSYSVFSERRALALERGEPYRQVEVGGPRELRELGTAFYRMAGAVEARTRELGLVMDAVHAVSSAKGLDSALNELAANLARVVEVPICRVPLLAQDKVIGLLTLGETRPRCFTAEDKRL